MTKDYYILKAHQKKFLNSLFLTILNLITSVMLHRQEKLLLSRMNPPRQQAYAILE